MKRLVHRLSAATMAVWLMVLGQLVFQADAAYAKWPPDLQVSSTECEDGTNGVPCKFKVDFEEPLSLPVWFYADTVSITAIGGADFVPLTRFQVYAPQGVSEVTITVEIINDRECEQPETFALRLSGGALGRVILQQDQTIIDRDC